MSTGKFKQTIRIGSNVTDIIALPCVVGCNKRVIGNKTILVYNLFGDTQNYHAIWGEVNRAYKGDWLCEDHNGKWHVLSDKEYKETVKL